MLRSTSMLWSTHGQLRQRVRYTTAAAHHGHRSALLSSPSSSSNTTDSIDAASTAPPLRIGVLGLGAIGTIFFTKLSTALHAQANTVAAAATSPRGLAATHTPRFTVDALVKPQHFDRLFATSTQPLVALHEERAVHNKSNDSSSSSDASHQQLQPSPLQIASSIAFRQQTPHVAVATHTNSIRIRALTPPDNNTSSNSNSNNSTEVAANDVTPLDVVLVTVKAYDSAVVVQQLQQQHAQLLASDALVVLLQNGLSDASPLLSSAMSAWRFAHSVTYVGGRSLSLGHVVMSGIDAAATFVAPVSDSESDATQTTARIAALCHILSAAGLHSEQLSADAMRAMQWTKLIVNAGINPIAAVLNASNHSVGACAWSRASVESVVREAFAVAQHEHVALECSVEELVTNVLRVAANTGTNVCSTVADLRRGSRTEIDAITGQIVALGRKHGVATPANELLLQLVHALEGQRTHHVNSNADVDNSSRRATHKDTQ